MPVTLDIPPLEERADTPLMRHALMLIGENQHGLLEMQLTRLARKLGVSHAEAARTIRVAENCGWVELETNSVGSIFDIKLTVIGWAKIGGTPVWLKAKRRAALYNERFPGASSPA